MRCPKCASENVQFVSNTTTTGPSISQGCCGWILLGPVGLLCSLCGCGSETEEYWICHSCGSKFKEGEYESELQNKTNTVEKLRRDIEKLENVLQNQPDDLEVQLNVAKEEYDVAEKHYKNMEKEFINSSGFLKFINIIYWLICIISVLIFLFGGFMLIACISAGDLGWGVVFAIGCGILTIVLINIADIILKKAKMNVNQEKAKELEIMWNDVRDKEKRYKDLKSVKDNIVSHEQKLRELDKAEKELHEYSGTEK